MTRFQIWREQFRKNVFKITHVIDISSSDNGGAFKNIVLWRDWIRYWYKQIQKHKCHTERNNWRGNVCPSVRWRLLFLLLLLSTSLPLTGVLIWTSVIDWVGGGREGGGVLGLGGINDCNAPPPFEHTCYIPLWQICPLKMVSVFVINWIWSWLWPTCELCTFYMFNAACIRSVWCLTTLARQKVHQTSSTCLFIIKNNNNNNHSIDVDLYGVF